MVVYLLFLIENNITKSKFIFSLLRIQQFSSRHVNDWEFRYDLLDMLLQEGGDPNVEGRDGSLPLMVCLVPLGKTSHDALKI